MSPTWDVYEAWCFITLARVLRSSLPHLEWREFPSEGKARRGGLEGHGSNLRVRLLYQHTFPSSSGNLCREFASVSKELRPDLILTIDGPDFRSWLVLDAKYSHSRSAILDAMDSAHIYHDALRYFGTPPRRSLLLVPSCGTDTHWLLESAFKHEHGIGIVRCRPPIQPSEEGFPELREMLTEFVDKAN
jgi:hypothetical protein